MMVSMPVRVAPVLASNVKMTSPEPVPLLVLTCIHAASLVAVQGPPVKIRTLSLPAVGPSTRALVPRYVWNCLRNRQ